MTNVTVELVAAIAARLGDDRLAFKLASAAEPLWNVLEEAAMVDSFGGMECTRVLPTAIAFIRAEANTVPSCVKPAARAPLTPKQRRELAAQVLRGDPSSILRAPGGLPATIVAHPGHGEVIMDEPLPWSPDEARRVARVLLEAADWAEFGPGDTPPTERTDA
jgi:hypothetical protein